MEDWPWAGSYSTAPMNSVQYSGTAIKRLGLFHILVKKTNINDIRTLSLNGLLTKVSYHIWPGRDPVSLQQPEKRNCSPETPVLGFKTKQQIPSDLKAQSWDHYRITSQPELQLRYLSMKKLFKTEK